MDKIAEMVRDAEIRGALAAFVDAGLVKVASQEAFEGLVAAVGNKLGEDDYDLQKVAAVTDEILGEAEKTAAVQDDELIRNAALGELLQMKVAGQIDDETFQKEASQLMNKEAYNVRTHKADVQKKRDAARAAMAETKKPRVAPAPAAKPGLSVAKKIGLGAGGLAAAAGTAALGKMLYDKYNANSGTAKVAEEADDQAATNAALGELLQMKVAGQIDDETFQKEANALLRLGGKVRDAIMKAPGAGKAVNALNTAKAGIGNRLNAVTPKQKLMGAAGAGFAAGGLADHLVNKYRNPA